MNKRKIVLTATIPSIIYASLVVHRLKQCKIQLKAKNPDKAKATQVKAAETSKTCLFFQNSM